MLTGEGGLEYLNNQSTNDLKILPIGGGCETVFVSATAQILDLTTIYRTENGIWLITSPQRRQQLREILLRTLIFVRGTRLEDRSDDTALFSLVGPRSTTVLAQLGLEIPADLPLHHHLTVTLPGLPGAAIRVAKGNGLGLPGFTLLMETAQAEPVCEALTGAGMLLADRQAWESLCLLQGRPEADRELTEAYNPLEAGLWHAISLSKGCYIGQEVLAKQVTYGRIRQALWGIQLAEPAPAGGEVQIDGSKVGVLTRAAWTEQGYVGLAYIRSKFAPQAGQEIWVDGVRGELLPRPYLTYPPSNR